MLIFLYSYLFRRHHPKRFLFLTASGKSTALKLFDSLVPPRRTYVMRVEGLVFGLQELTGLQNTLIMCHDVGNTFFYKLTQEPSFFRINTKCSTEK